MLMCKFGTVKQAACLETLTEAHQFRHMGKGLLEHELVNAAEIECHVEVTGAPKTPDEALQDLEAQGAGGAVHNEAHEKIRYQYG